MLGGNAADAKQMIEAVSGVAVAREITEKCPSVRGSKRGHRNRIKLLFLILTHKAARLDSEAVYIFVFTDADDVLVNDDATLFDDRHARVGRGR